MAGSAAYEPIARIGRGASSEVFRARDADGGIVALKVMLGAEAGRAGVLDHLAAEVALSRRIDHPGLVRLLDSGLFEGQPFLAMELIEGPTLKAAMAQGRQPLARSLSIARSVAATLAKIHDAGAVHRDVKPDNIMLRAATGPVLMDLGVAALAPADRDQDRDLVGAPGYLAPEVIDGRAFDGKADIFALGVVLYMLVSGRRPFGGAADEAMARIRQSSPPPPSSLVSALPPALDAIVARALAKSPVDRLSAVEFADLLATLDG